MSEVEVVLVDPDEELRELAASLPFRWAVTTDDATIASASVALVREASAARCRAAGTPALVLGGPDVPGGAAVHSRADVAEWVRALLADPEALAAAARHDRTGLPRPVGLPSWDPLPPPIDEQRRLLADAPPQARNRYRVVHIGTYVFGETDVVARIVLALRNLGHDVFTVDPRRAEGLAEISQLDGVTPIEIDVAKLEPLLRRYEPDVIVWDAGGFHPSAEAARVLRERGIALIHLVLSDPDAHATARTFADRFDLVATNARDCVASYVDLGVPVVRHLPFAVDRDFVVAPARERPDWRTDVICLGHGRPDRQGTMKHLAERFDVRVYGNRWELPAVVARDHEVVTALRSGVFHINFPATKAGFTNVKVGVFESIAQGGVLCTGIFDEMATLFAYDREIVGYAGDEQLAAAISYLKGHPDEADEIRRRGFARLAADHLWERRLDPLFTALEEAGTLQPRTDGPIRRFVALGFWGMRNLGDELILRVTADELQRRFPGCIVRGIGFDPGRMLVEEGFDGPGIDDAFAAEDRIREADVLLFGGGGLVHDLTFRLAGGVPDLVDNHTSGLAGFGKFLLLAMVHRVPVAWHALGAGPLATPDARNLVAFLAGPAAAVTVRDADSASALASCGVEAIVAADPTFLLARPTDEAIASARDRAGLGQEPYAFVALRHFTGADEGFEERITAALDAFADETELRLVFVPFQRSSGSGDDAAVHARVAAGMRADSIIVAPQTPVEDLLALLAGARCGVAMRLHASILAGSFGVPSCGLAYDPKVTAHYRSLGIEDLALPLDAPAPVIAKTLTALATDPAAAVARSAEAVDEMRARARISFDRLETVLADAPPPSPRRQAYPRRTSARAHELETMRRRAVRRGQDIRTLKAEVRDLKARLKQAERRRSQVEQRLTGVLRNPLVRLGLRVKRLTRRGRGAP